MAIFNSFLCVCQAGYIKNRPPTDTTYPFRTQPDFGRSAASTLAKAVEYKFILGHNDACYACSWVGESF